MPGLGIVIPKTGGTGPVVELDSMLAAGSLFLLDPAHSAEPWAAGVPALNATVPNIASAKAAALIGSGTSATLAGTVVQNSGLTGTTGLLERTSKGALHSIISNGASSPAATGIGFSISLPDLIKTYILANLSHGFYMSVWRKVTRISGNTGTTQAYATLCLNSGGSNNFLTYQSLTTNRPISSGTPSWLGSLLGTPDVLGDRFQNVAAAGWTGTLPGSNSAFAATAFGCGRLSSTYGGGSQTSLFQSQIFRRMYVEDLTVSGRSYATVSALDQARFASDVTTAGGRYYGDTYTDPAGYVS